MAHHNEPEVPVQLRITKTFLKHHPQVEAAISVAEAVISKVQFPINSFQDLIDAMGGKEASLPFGGRSFTVGELETRIPSYYFPIANENDLIAKIGDLSKRMPSVAAPAPVLIPATASMSSVASPAISLDEIRKSSGFAAGIPAVGGIKR